MKKLLLAVLLAVFVCTAFTGVSMATSSAVANYLLWEDWCYIGSTECESYLQSQCAYEPAGYNCLWVGTDENGDVYHLFRADLAGPTSIIPPFENWGCYAEVHDTGSRCS